MQVVVELYAAARQSFGASELTLEVKRPDGLPPTLADVRAALGERMAELKPLIALSRLAINGTLACAETIAIVENDRIALLLPVSGG